MDRQMKEQIEDNSLTLFVISYLLHLQPVELEHNKYVG